MSDRCELVVAGPASRALTEEFPEPVAVAVIDFITGALLDEPRRVGRELRREVRRAVDAIVRLRQHAQARPRRGAIMMS